MQTDSDWVQAALRDWGRRHRGKPGDEIGHARAANFARYMPDQFDRSGPAPVTDESCEVDSALGFLRTRGRQGRIEAYVLIGTYLLGLPRAQIARRLCLGEHDVRNARMMGERSVEMFLVMRCGWDADEGKSLAAAC